MADSKDNTNNKELVNTAVAPEVAPIVAEQEVVVEETPSRPDLQLLGGDFNLKSGENLYFFPELQKSVAAKSMEAAVKQVQSELDALKQSKENK